MRNLLITISFNGSAYHGYQVQKGLPTVGGTFQRALWALLGSRDDIKGCSRTDTGVHANMYCLSVKTQSPIPCDGLVRALNGRLPDDIAALSCEERDMDFHARYSCKAKSYLYKIYNSDIKSPFLTSMAHRYAYPLDDELMNAAAQDFLGTHDFSSFCATGGTVEDKVRTIYGARVWREGNMVYFKVRGDGFLYNMVRIMTGTLIGVSAGRFAPGAIPGIIAARDRNLAGMTAPGCGLYLDEVFY